MTRQEFNSYLDDITSETGFDLSKEQKAFAYQAANEYHSQALRIHNVVGQSEQLKAFADYAQKRVWEDGDKDLFEFVDEFLRL